MKSDLGAIILFIGVVIFSSAGKDAAAISTFLTNSYTGGGVFFITLLLALDSAILAAAFAFNFFIKSEDLDFGASSTVASAGFVSLFSAFGASAAVS